MTRPSLPIDGAQPWGTELRNAIWNVSDRIDAIPAGGGGVGGTPDDNTITTVKLVDDAVTNAKVATGISADKISDGATNHTFTAADDTKLGTIAANATANPLAVVNVAGFGRVWGRTAAQGFPTALDGAVDGDWLFMDAS